MKECNYESFKERKERVDIEMKKFSEGIKEMFEYLYNLFLIRRP